MRTSTQVAIIVSVAFCGLLTANTTKVAESPKTESSASSATTTVKHQQLIVWTSRDREVALKMVFMYAENCKKRQLMDTVRLLVWGPSGKLLVEDPQLQQRLNELKMAGVELYACKACADEYGISDKLSKLGITVIYTGSMLAELQKSGWHVLSF
jgi:hypothetical protein